MKIHFSVLGVLTALFLTCGLASSTASGPDHELQLVVIPASLELQVGHSLQLETRVTNAAGESLDVPVVFFSTQPRSVEVTADGTVTAHEPGTFRIFALVPENYDDEPESTRPRVRVGVPVSVPSPPVDRVRFSSLPGLFYASTRVSTKVSVVDRSGQVRHDIPLTYATNRPEIASFDSFGQLTLHRTGEVELLVEASGASDRVQIEVRPNPGKEIQLHASAEEGRTGDPVHFSATVLDADGQPVSDMPLHFSVSGQPVPEIVAPGAYVQIDADGRLVAERSGTYRVTVSSGNLVADKLIRMEPRNVRQEIQVVGQGAVRDRHTSDLWVWEGVDGRDYAMTGTWGADGHAYVWDVTSPKSISLVDVVHVDARTVNDVKVSEDGRIAVISREGASTRRNGIVILDVSSPLTGVRILSRYDDQLTGGVHNVFLYNDHVFALSATRRFDVINIADPTHPYRVGRFELETPGHAIHDVWVAEGIAYSSNWKDGIVAIDVGGGNCNGSVSNPTYLGSYAYPSGWNHAAFPYRSQSTGKFYVFAGDEAFPYGFSIPGGGVPSKAAGWVHVIEWDSWETPREVARYQVPEAGTHNLWVEDDILYAAYYNGGLRVVDVSGELHGDLYRQGREIAVWQPFDPEGYIANAPWVWGAQPFKGHIFVADWNSGLWAVKLAPEQKDPELGEPR